MKTCKRCGTRVDSWVAKFCTECGSVLIIDPLYEQIELKVYKYSDPEQKGFKHTPIQFDPKLICQVWAVPFCDSLTLPIELQQHHNAFYQDQVHDWNYSIIGGKYHFKYHGADNCNEYMQLVIVLKKEV